MNLINKKIKWILVVWALFMSACATSPFPGFTPASRQAASNEEEILRQIGPLEKHIGEYASQRRYAEAEPFARQAVDITGKGLGPERPLVALVGSRSLLFSDKFSGI